MGLHGPDADALAVLRNALQGFDAGQVDEVRRRRQTLLHSRHQGHAAGQIGAVVRRPPTGHGVGDICGPMIFKSVHAPALFS